MCSKKNSLAPPGPLSTSASGDKSQIPKFSPDLWPFVDNEDS